MSAMLMLQRAKTLRATFEEQRRDQRPADRKLPYHAEVKGTNGQLFTP